MSADRIIALARQHLAAGNVAAHRSILEFAIRASLSVRRADKLRAALLADCAAGGC